MSRREQIRMTDDELADFLDAPRNMAVATLGPTGHPHLVAMWFGFVRGDGFGDGQLAMWTYAKSQKAVNLRRDPRLTCLVEDGDAYHELRGVEITGRAELVDDPDTLLAVGEALFRRYQDGDLTDEDREAIRARAAKRVAILVDVEDVTSWDHRKLGGTY
ncbi:MAG: TIGR03618 family F420-dependent PPOX class oxidoreductase [Actinobacteria bacterium]|nr:TIGR03618 family F420-dependent PPOX class oxidoreductase [Actinomycetota bacterium]